MGTKYEVPHLRRDVIKHLEMVYTTTFDNFDPHRKNELITRNPTTHAIRAVLMARENDVPSILPVALYFCCELSTTQIALGVNDGKFKLSHQVGPSLLIYSQ